MANGGEIDIIDDKDLEAPLKMAANYEKLADTFDDVVTSTTKLNQALSDGTQTTAEQRRTADELAKSQKKLDDANKKAAKSTRDYSKEMEYANEATGGAIGKVKAMGAQLWALAANPVGAFLLLVAGAIASIGVYFKSSGDGADKFDKIMSSISAITSFLTNKVAALGEQIVKLFEGGSVLGEAFMWVFNRILNMVVGVIDTFTNLLKVINILSQYNIKDIFTGNLKPEDIKALKKAFVDLGKSVISAYTGIGDAADEAGKSVVAFNQLTEAIDNLGDQIRARILSKAQAELEIEKLLFDAKDKSNKSDAQRLAALKESVAISKQQLKTDLDIATQKERTYTAELLLQHGLIGTQEEMNKVLAEGATLEQYNLLLVKGLEPELEKQYQLRADIVNLQRQFFADNKKSIAQIAALEKEIAEEAIKQEEKRLAKRLTAYDAYIKGSSETEGAVLIGFKSSQEQREDIASRSAERIAGEAKRWADYEKSLEKQKTDWLAEQAKKRQELMEKLNMAAQIASDIVGEIASRRNQELDDRSKIVEENRKKELEGAGDDARKKLAIDRKYDREQAKIKEKQAQAEKRAALFNILISTAMAIAKASPVVPLMVLAAAVGAVQGALVASRPVPKFWMGTKNTPDTFIAGDRGHEIVSKGGNSMLVDRPTMFMGMEGAQVFNKRDTDNILGDVSDVRGALNYGAKNKTKEIAYAFVEGNRETNKWLKKIANKPETSLVVDRDGFRQYSGRMAKQNEYYSKAFSGR